jgi:hypothetical protein
MRRSEVVVQEPNQVEGPVRIQDTVLGQFYQVTNCETKWIIYRNTYGVIFVDDLDFFPEDSSRLRSSDFLCRKLPKGTVIDIKTITY